MSHVSLAFFLLALDLAGGRFAIAVTNVLVVVLVAFDRANTMRVLGKTSFESFRHCCGAQTQKKKELPLLATSVSLL